MTEKQKQNLLSIWQFIKDNPNCTGSQIQKSLAISKDSINKAIVMLVDDGNVERHHMKKKGYYYYQYTITNDELHGYGFCEKVLLIPPVPLKKWLKLPKFVQAITPCNETT